MDFIGSIVTKALDRLRPGWRERQATKRSPWNAFSVMFVFIFGGIIWYWSFRLMWNVHLYYYPAHAGHLREFWNEGIGLKAFISSLILLMPLGISSLFLGITCSNLLLWCIPPARHVFKKQGQLVPELSFFHVMKEALFWSIPAVLVSFSLSFLGAWTLVNLK